jgi:hypothetical protein
MALAASILVERGAHRVQSQHLNFRQRRHRQHSVVREATLRTIIFTHRRSSPADICLFLQHDQEAACQRQNSFCILVIKFIGMNHENDMPFNAALFDIETIQALRH